MLEGPEKIVKDQKGTEKGKVKTYHSKVFSLELPCPACQRPSSGSMGSGYPFSFNHLGATARQAMVWS